MKLANAVAARAASANKRIVLTSSYVGLLRELLQMPSFGWPMRVPRYSIKLWGDCALRIRERPLASAVVARTVGRTRLR